MMMAGDDWKCPICNGSTAKDAVNLMRRISANPSMRELWHRLERAEADRDRMRNAVQLAVERMNRELEAACRQRRETKLKFHDVELLTRALNRMSDKQQAA